MINPRLSTRWRGAVWIALLVNALLAGASGQESVTVEKDVAVPMRDGTVLRADIYRPADFREVSPLPVLLSRTPYNKNGRAGQAKKFAAAGYIVVSQDARGRYASDGEWESFVQPEVHDGEDGFDTVEWAAKLPGSTGKVGTFGGSYNAFLQWRLAALAPPSLVAMSAHSIPARYTDLEGPGAFRPGRRLQWWLGNMSPDLRKRSGAPGTTTTAEGKAQWRAESEKWLWFLPWSELPRPFFEEETGAVQAWLANPTEDPWKLHEGVPSINVPNLDAVGWFDHCNGNMLLHKTMRELAATPVAREQTRLIVGPWSHAGRGRSKVGKIDFGPEAKVDLLAEEIRWFDHWLKGKDNGVDRDPRVRVFVMGDNTWRDEEEWPPARARWKQVYLTSDGGAHTPEGDGRLLFEPADDNCSDTFKYDPANPVPSLYAGGAFTVPADQSPLADRRDILVYQSEPLEERLEVTGNPFVELYASTTAPDTDFFVRLIDVAPDGTNHDVSMGLVRASHRRGFNVAAILREPTPVEPKKAYRYTIRMNPTSIAFLPGHRIRLDITSSDFPNYDRHHNTTDNQNSSSELVVARQNIYHGEKRPSRLLLPVVPAK